MSRRLFSILCVGALLAGATATAPARALLPTSGQILFVGDQDGNLEIYSIASDGGQQSDLTNAPAAQDMDPGWSPDGTKIAFARHTVRLGGPHIVTTPDGSTIAFTRCCPNGQSSIYVMPSTGAAATKVTPDGINASHPSWSPDGTRIAFTGFPAGGGARNISTIAPDGTGMTQLTDTSW